MTARRALTAALAGLAAATAALGAGPAAAEPVTPTLPVPPPPPNAEAMTPGQPAVVPAAVPADPAAPPPAPPPGPPGVPEIPNPQYGSGKYGGGILGTLRDLWDTARNPTFAQEQLYGPEGARPVPPPGAGPAPELPPGYVSINAPGSEAPIADPDGPDAGRPELPPGYYRLDGPPPPGYFDTPVIPTTLVPPPLIP